jgi:hypothetical protein
MKDIAATDPLVDDLGALLDAAAADPARVSALKAQLQARLAGRPVGIVPAPDAVEDADDEDLWNNLPL